MSRKERKAELAANLAALRRRMAMACAAAGRDPGEITLIAVTKTFPASDIRLLAELGVTDIGENRDQEAAAKAAVCTDPRLTWHFVGQLQSNKCNSVAGYADVVHSVDRPRLVTALDRAAQRAERRLRCLVQVSFDDGAGRGGVPASDVPALAALVAATDALEIAGVMAVAPLDGDSWQAFAELAKVAAQIRAQYPAATMISAGMSDDFEIAIKNGATHVRVGTALLGGRQPIVR